MARISDSRTPFYNFLNLPEFRIWRHLCLILAVVFVSLNYAFSIEYNYPIKGVSLLLNHTFIAYVTSLIFSYLLIIYFNFYFLIPRFLLKKKYLPYIISLCLLIGLLLVTQYHIELFFLSLLEITITHPTYNFNDRVMFFLDVFANFFLNLITFIGCSVTILLKHWMNEDQRVNQLERQHLQTEVEHLKEQVNPDFLFHSLNRIAVLEESDPKQASFMLISLSRLLRYQLYDCNREQVFLTSEIQYLTNYLNLEKLYYGNIQYTISSDGEINHILVPPLIFIPFVQYIVNKINIRDLHTNINLHFQSDDETIRFTCNGNTNDKPNHIRKLKDSGNDNAFQKIRQRLNLLFDDDYQLETRLQLTDIYISLQLKL